MKSTDICLNDQVAFITGAANGIGEGIATSLARFGAHIAIADIDRENGERVATAIRELGREALFIETDVNDTDQISLAIDAVATRFGRLDILVNNAGGVRKQPFLDQSERSWRKHIDFNFISTLCATQAGAKLMIDGKRGGTIINIASSEGLRAAPEFAVYAACKAAIINFTRTMALELSGHGIRVHALAPDMIATKGLQAFFDAQGEAGRIARDHYIPMQRLGSVEEIGSVAVFLASKMSSYLTGLTIPVDAGVHASSGWSRSVRTGEWNLHHW